jgi:hypothetical protein
LIQEAVASGPEALGNAQGAALPGDPPAVLRGPQALANKAVTA